MSCFDPSTDSPKLFRAGNSEAHPRSQAEKSSLQPFAAPNPKNNPLAFEVLRKRPPHLLCKPSACLNLISHSLHQGPFLKPLPAIACGRPIRFRNRRRIYELVVPSLPAPLSPPPHPQPKPSGRSKRSSINRFVKEKWIRSTGGVQKRSRTDQARLPRRCHPAMLPKSSDTSCTRTTCFHDSCSLDFHRFWLVRVHPSCSTR